MDKWDRRYDIDFIIRGISAQITFVFLKKWIKIYIFLRRERCAFLKNQNLNKIDQKLALIANCWIKEDSTNVFYVSKWWFCRILIILKIQK